ncbi:MAG: hypothetical protein QOJ84_3054 [Bradyrhizobium sp.]|jgi:hypothetical protein|nr:hypothetical protein [Bradyrhizobium sp.]
MNDLPSTIAITKNKTLWKVALSGVGIFLAVIILIAAGLGALVYLLFSPSQKTLIVWSPARTAGVIKTYLNESDLVTVGLLRATQSVAEARSLFSLPAKEVWGEEGATVGWEGERHLTFGWPSGMRPIQGPTRVGDIKISYLSYDPILAHSPQENRRKIQLRDVTAAFDEQEGRGAARYAESGEPVPETKCIIEINGVDSVVFDKITVRFTGNGRGRPSDRWKSYGAVSVDVAFKTSTNLAQPAQTPTQMQVGSVVPMQASTSAPNQDTWKVGYGGYSKSEALKLFSEINAGKIEVLVALNFGSQILNYVIDGRIIGNDIIERFNICSAKTNVYGTPFFLPK